ncbi:MAG: hypothetical protein AAF682_02185 [Planctomycetota bacterium]
MTQLEASSRLGRWWFAPAPPQRLAVLRIAVGLWSLWYLVPRYEMYAKIARTKHSLYDPVGLARVLVEPLPPGVFDFLQLALLGAALLFTLGWKHRVTGPAFGVLLLGVLSYRNSWSMVYHNDNVLVLHGLVLGFARSADALSMDAWSRSRDAGWTYGWPVRLLCAATVLTYFVSGVAKVASPLGFGWASGDVLRDQIAVDAVRKRVFGSEASDLFYGVYDLSLLFLFIGVVTLVVELGAPLFLLGRRAPRVWALLAFGMHWGILLLMGITFRYQLSGLVFLPFFPVERPVAWAVDRLRAGRSDDRPAERTA